MNAARNGSSRGSVRGSVAWAFVLFVSLAAIVWALSRETQPSPDRPAPLRPLFRTGPAVDAITAVARVGGAAPARVERGEGWSEAVRPRLRMALNAQLERVVDAEANAPERFGLAAPAQAVHFYAADAAAPVLELRVGDLAPDGLSYFVEARPGPGIAKLPAYQVENLDALLGTSP